METRFTMHELSKLLKIPYASFYRTIETMKDTVITETVGHSKILKLNLKNSTIKSYLSIASAEEKKEFLRKQPIISKLASEIKGDEIVLLFGSYAKRTETEKSDIDLLIINNGKRTISFTMHELLFKKKINPLFITKKEFAEMLKENEENVGKQALKSHIVLNNPEAFWGCVLDAIR